MNPTTFFVAGLLSLAPISELRGAIPYAFVNGMPLALCYVYCVALNALIGPVVYVFLNTLHHLFYKWNWYRSLFNRIVERARGKVKEKIDRYGYLGIMLFVGVPLPITGAYTGTLGAWILGLDKKKTCIAVLGGVMISGLVVSLIMHFGAGAYSIFIKQI